MNEIKCRACGVIYTVEGKMPKKFACLCKGREFDVLEEAK